MGSLKVLNGLAMVAVACFNFGLSRRWAWGGPVKPADPRALRS